MCGLLALICADPQLAATAKDDVAAALAVQAHRGPDDSAVWCGDGVLLGFNLDAP